MKFPSLPLTRKLLKPSAKLKNIRTYKSKIKSRVYQDSYMTAYDKIEEIISIANVDYNSLEIVVKFYNLTEIQQQLAVVTLIEHQMLDTLRVILQSEYAVNFLIRGQSPLHYAIQLDSIPLVKMLIDNGADIEFKNVYKESALSFAVHAGNAEIIELLLDKGADVNAEASDKSTPLDYAVNQGNADIVNMLRNYGALLGGSYLVKSL